MKVGLSYKAHLLSIFPEICHVPKTADDEMFNSCCLLIWIPGKVVVTEVPNFKMSKLFIVLKLDSKQGRGDVL